jgi:sigma-B regulation protein RsbU (phosphoserine phosphatase)
VLFLYTDGVTEAMNHDRELFSEKRLTDLLARARTDGVEGIVGLVDRAIKDFARGAVQSDDITMLALKFTGKKGA